MGGSTTEYQKYLNFSKSVTSHIVGNTNTQRKSNDLSTSGICKLLTDFLKSLKTPKTGTLPKTPFSKHKPCGT